MSSPRKASLLLGAGLCLLAGPASADVAPPGAGPHPIWGGENNQPCEWPQAVNVDTSSANCTGTLVHPQVVLTARHCGAGHAAINFGEDANSPAQTLSATCHLNPVFEDFQDDAAYCILDEPADFAVYTPPLVGCNTELLQEGTNVVITGYGKDENGKRGPKNVAEAPLIRVEDRWVEIGAPLTSACHGDSGGPAFVQLADGSWRPFGIVHGRYDVNPFDPPPDLCGSWAAYVRMDSIVAWVEEESGIDITPCTDADGTWNPGPECTGFPLESGAGGSWTNWCESMEVSGFSAACGPAYDDGSGDPGGSSGGEDTDGDGGSGTGGGASAGTTGAGEDTDGGAVFIDPDAGSDSDGQADGSAGGCRVGDADPVAGLVLLPVLAGLRQRRG